MIASVREAKANLSKLVKIAESGEEVVITVHGEPKVRLTQIAPNDREGLNYPREKWVAELKQLAEETRVGEPKSTPQEFWDELRADRF